MLKTTKPKYWIVATDKSHPLWEEFSEFIIEKSDGFLTASGQFQYYGYDGSTKDGFQCWNKIGIFFNNPQPITLEQWKEWFGTTEVNKKTSVRHTYTTTHIREDGVIFTNDGVNGKTIEQLEEEEKEYNRKAREIRGWITSHKSLKF